MQLIGAILVMLGLIFSLSIISIFGIGIVFGVPLIIVGLTMIFLPNFWLFSILILIVTVIIGSLMGIESYEGYAIIFISAAIIAGLSYQFRQEKSEIASTPSLDEAIDSKLCPYCGEAIKKIAIKCKHCKSDL